MAVWLVVWLFYVNLRGKYCFCFFEYFRRRLLKALNESKAVAVCKPIAVLVHANECINPSLSQGT